MSAIGVDLGTTNSCIGVFRNDKVDIIINESGNRMTPSYVAFTEEEQLIGDNAKNQIVMNPTKTVIGAKRLIGIKYSELRAQKSLRKFQFKIVCKNYEDKPQIEIENNGEKKYYYPEEILAMVLINMKKNAEKQLRKKITDAVFTVPSYFSAGQRLIMHDIASIAGLNVLRVIPESTAASIAFDHLNKSKENRFVLIFDLGSGTLSISLMEIEDSFFEVKAVGGTNIGGENFDMNMVSYFADRFETKFNCDLRRSPRAMMKLKIACEHAKIALSTSARASIICDSLYCGHDFMDSISRSTFEKLNEELFKSTITHVENVLKDGKLSKEKVTDIVLVGGSSHIPRVQELLQDYFNKKPKRGVDAKEAVAYGAAILAAASKGDKSESIKNFFFLNA